MSCTNKQLAIARAYRLKYPDRIKANRRRCNQKNKLKYREYSRAYRATHKELYRAADKRRRLKHADKIREARRIMISQKRATDTRYRILDNLRRRINHALNGNNKSDRTVQLLGCSIESFKLYLESLFEFGMSWDNYGSVWEIDHILPCALFDLTKPEHQMRCFHFSNQQPLGRADNLRKSNKVLGDLQPTFT